MTNGGMDVSQHTHFQGFDLTDFWDEYDGYTSAEEVTDERIAETERLLGYKLPLSYVELIRTKNGGSPVNVCFPMDEDEGYIAISAICGIGGEWGIDSDSLGSRHMIDNWGYPDIGIVFGECPSAGHDAIMFDYSQCGPQGEPRIIHVDVEVGEGEEPVRTFLASDFETFIRGLVHEDVYDTSEEDKQFDLEKARHAPFTPLLQQLCVSADSIFPQAEQTLRRLAESIIEEKGFFALHADLRSHLMYDLEFLLYVNAEGAVERDAYLAAYDKMLVFGPGGAFSTGGYAPGFVSDWLDERIKSGKIVEVTADRKLAFAKGYYQGILRQAAEYS
ncbi:SMI1/KNR4 family protein [Saccharibacillus endophyticus]|uniref:SMI1/KNR4 family protein n=1 Tax=Saccharibacillus endophyticus TaxID=2060666 RepID=UPI00155566C3|nr:SMI1/KNR4 family protein [Saccharibacillus endophyticus]